MKWKLAFNTEFTEDAEQRTEELKVRIVRLR
jgi:hypothetical protein